MPLVVIGGPTGVGKTAVAVELARRVPIEVISADSRQVYRGMDVATGKPTREVRQSVVHHLIDVVDPDDRYQAARFRHDAAAAIDAIRARGRLPVVVGGTGLYIRALLRGLDPAPPADPAFCSSSPHWRPGKAGRRSTRASAARPPPWRVVFIRTITCGWCAPSRWPARARSCPSSLAGMTRTGRTT